MKTWAIYTRDHQWTQQTERYLSVMLFRFRALSWYKPQMVLYLDTDSVVVSVKR